MPDDLRLSEFTFRLDLTVRGVFVEDRLRIYCASNILGQCLELVNFEVPAYGIVSEFFTELAGTPRAVDGDSLELPDDTEGSQQNVA